MANTVHLSTLERWFPAKWSWVRGDERGSTPAGASSRGRFFGPCFTSGPPSRDVLHRKKQRRRLRFRLGTMHDKFARTRKTRFVRRFPPHVDSSVSLPRGLPLLPPSLTWREAFFVRMRSTSIHHMPRTIHRATIFIGRNCIVVEFSNKPETSLSLFG